MHGPNHPWLIGLPQVFQPETVWELQDLQVVCGTMGLPTATVRLRGPDGLSRVSTAIGTGPVDAAYQAIDQLVQVSTLPTCIRFACCAMPEGSCQCIALGDRAGAVPADGLQRAERDARD